jgi:hypothetical protein
MIATNSIAQGDTRKTALQPILESGGSLIAANPRFKWPGLAAVVVSTIHVAKLKAPITPVILNGKIVRRINAFLLEGDLDSDPHPLEANQTVSFKGTDVNGLGFTFNDRDTTGEANPLVAKDDLIANDPRNEELIQPLIGGEEVNDSPTQSAHRYVINFGDRSEIEASKWPDLFEVVQRRVFEKRQKNNRECYRRLWWQFAEKRKALYDHIAELSKVTVIARVSKTFAICRLPAQMVFSDQLVVFASQSNALFSALQAQAHESWCRLLGSSMKDDLRYTPTDCFETFPFPENWESDSSLEETGREYYDYRAALMIRNDEGLTKTYNRFHDPEEKSPDILKLRELHAAMDRAVIDAYGWDIKDKDLVCEFIPDFTEEDDDGNEIPKNIRYRWPDEVRDDVLARLLALNAERHAAEVNAGLHAKGTTKPKAAKKAAKKVATPRKEKPPEPILFGLQEKPWLDAIHALTVEIPTDSRPSLGSALGYYRLLIPTLAQEAGGSIPLQLLVAAAKLLEDRDILLSAVDGLTEGAKKRWRDRFKEVPEAGVFREALRSLAVDSRRIRVVGPKGAYEVRDQPGDPIKSPWLITDARLLLKAAVALEAQGTATGVPSGMIEEIAAEVRTA